MGYMSSFPKSGAAQIAQVALELATTQPQLVFRNPDKIEQGWKRMREDRAAFIEFFGGDELVLSPAEALLRRRKAWYYEHEPRPGVSVIGARLAELAALR